jgi:hypothetical protein
MEDVRETRTFNGNPDILAPVTNRREISAPFCSMSYIDLGFSLPNTHLDNGAG